MQATKAISYVRVSTAAQGRSGLGLEAQEAAVGALVAQRGFAVIADYREVESGKRNDRSELAKAIQHAKLTGAVLIIAKLDRLSRNASFLLQLRDSGVRFIAADIPDANDLTIGLLAVVAQAEREAISSRTKAALGIVRRRIAVDGFHVSKTGRTIHRLGNPNGAAQLKLHGRNRLGAEATRSAAQRRAEVLRTFVTHAMTGGIDSYRCLAERLNESGILTPRNRRWHASSARNLALRLTSPPKTPII